MGVDIHVRILKYDDGEWKPVWLYKKNKDDVFVKVQPYNYRNYELFEILQGESEYDDIANRWIDEKSLPAETKEEIEHCKDWCYGFNEINLADLRVYYLKHPLVKDYDVEWENDIPVLKTNPIGHFIDDIVNYVDFEDDFTLIHGDSCVKIIYWFDR